MLSAVVPSVIELEEAMPYMRAMLTDSSFSGSEQAAEASATEHAGPCDQLWSGAPR